MELCIGGLAITYAQKFDHDEVDIGIGELEVNDLTMWPRTITPDQAVVADSKLRDRSVATLANSLKR